MIRTLHFRAPFSLLLACGLLSASAQNVGINTTGAAPHPSALVDLVPNLPSNPRGLLIPRVTLAQRTAMFPVADATAEGMLVYQTDDAGTYAPATAHGFWYYDGATWIRWSNNVGWDLAGNAGTTPVTNFLGTAAGTGDDFFVRTNNVTRMTVLATGQVGVNNVAPLEALSITGALRMFKPLPLYPNLYSIYNDEGTIRYNQAIDRHEGNTTNNNLGWVVLENAETLYTGQDYATVTYSCPGSPGTTSGGTVTGSTPVAAPARHQQTPFPTGATNTASGSKVQYLFLASELSSSPFNLCAGFITELTLTSLDDDNTGPPPPGAALNLEIRIGNTASNNLTAWDAGVSASGIRYANGSITIVGGTNTFPIAPAFNWNGASNIIIEITYRKAGQPGVSPRVLLTQGLAFNATRYGYHTSNTVFHGNTFTDAPVFPGGLTLGFNATRPVFGFSANVQAGTNVSALGDYAQYDGGLMIGSPAWAAANYRGPGTVRAEFKVFDNSIQLTDHVFDRYYDGVVKPEDITAASGYKPIPLDELNDYLEENRHLPSMPSREQWTEEGISPLGELTTGIWETVETQALYIMELEKDLRVLEDITYAKGLTDAQWMRIQQDIQQSKRLSPEQKESLIATLRERKDTTK